jgi:uncharacterized protein YbaA (DUF1428 family)
MAAYTLFRLNHTMRLLSCLPIIRILKFSLENPSKSWNVDLCLQTKAQGDNMAKYVDGYIIPIKKKNVKAYKKMATLGCKVWMDHGALDYYECVGENLKSEWGMGFTKMCKLKPDETVIFAYVVYKSKADRKKINAKVMDDPRMHIEGMTMPFDGKRFCVGGFDVLVSSK